MEVVMCECLNSECTGKTHHVETSLDWCCRDRAVRMVTVPLAVGATFRYSIGADKPLATVEAVGVDSFGKLYAEVGFWHGGRAEHGISTRDAVRKVPMCEACASFAEAK